MKEFMQTHKIYLTPLSPIHIGCGEDFEPTNYIIDEGVLYHFEPSNLNLSEDKRARLVSLTNQLDLLAIQRFFIENKMQAVTSAHYFADVSVGLEQKYREKVGKVVQRESGNKEVVNNLAIERTAYLPFSSAVYIPGSSFKGVVATTLLEAIHKQKGQPKIDKEKQKNLVQDYLGGTADSILKSVKFADFMPVTNNVYSKIYYSVNFKKKPTEKGNKGKGISIRRECISAGQYRAFESKLALWENHRNPRALGDYFKLLNDFHRPIFNQECRKLVELGLVANNWVKEIDLLLHNDKVALIRLGKNGADSKTLQGDHIAQIKIMKGKGQKPEYKDSATTLWLASQQENQTNHLLPFGWALLEVDNGEENIALKQWCDQQPKSKVDKATILAKREAEYQRQQAEIAELKAKQEAERKAEAERNALINSLNDNQKLVMALVDKYQSSLEKQDDVNSSLFKETQQFINQAIENWNNEDKVFITQKITLDLIETRVNLKKKDAKKNFEKLLRKLTTEN